MTLNEEILNWNELLEIEDFNHEQLLESIDNLIEDENETKESAIKFIAKDFDYGEKLDINEFENILKDVNIVDENLNHKFPQANNINLAVLSLEIIINETANYDEADGRTNLDIATLLGFSQRQGSYYGDLLVYLGFLFKKEGRYFPTNTAMMYKKEMDRKKRNIILLKSMLRHSSIRNYFILFHNTLFTGKKELKEKLYNILKNDPLLYGFKESTIKRRGSTIEAMAKWSNQIVKTHPKPFVKWAGGKQRLMEKLKVFLPDENSYTQYIEPFVGGGSMFYNLKQKNSILNDYNEELINTYEQIKFNVKNLISELDKLENSEEDFYKIRNIDRNPIEYAFLTDVEKAARFIYLNKTSFNGLYRVNKNGEFNTPYGHNVNAMFKIFELLETNSKLFNKLNVKLFTGDYQKVLKYADHETFVYFDPPYDPISKTSNFTSYTNSGFDKNEQIRLKKNIDGLTRNGVKVMLSNSDTEFIRKLYSDSEIYTINSIDVYRNIASKTESRKVIKELVITNY